MVIVDEFHHAAANIYTRLLARVRPRELLSTGLSDHVHARTFIIG